MMIARRSVSDSTAEQTAQQAEQSRTANARVDRLASNEMVITTVCEYDSRLPADSLTGRPPLKRISVRVRRTDGTRRTVQHTISQTERQQASAESIARRQTDTTAAAVAERYSAKTALHRKTSESRGMTAVQHFLCGAGLLAVVGVVLWIILKLF